MKPKSLAILALSAVAASPIVWLLLNVPLFLLLWPIGFEEFWPGVAGVLGLLALVATLQAILIRRAIKSRSVAVAAVAAAVGALIWLSS